MAASKSKASKEWAEIDRRITQVQRMAVGAVVVAGLTLGVVVFECLWR